MGTELVASGSTPPKTPKPAAPAPLRRLPGAVAGARSAAEHTRIGAGGGQFYSVWWSA
jgi:hypothetical protein